MSAWSESIAWVFLIFTVHVSYTLETYNITYDTSICTQKNTHPTELELIYYHTNYKVCYTP